MEYRRTDDGRLICPCCATPQPQGSAIAYCDDCNTDTCGHGDRELLIRQGEQQ